MSRGKRFSREEKVTAVQLVLEGGRSMLSVANEYGIHENTLIKWRQIYRMDPAGAFLEAEEETEEGNTKETERMKRRIRELESEVDFLKKVSAYFAKHPR